MKINILLMVGMLSFLCILWIISEKQKQFSGDKENYLPPEVFRLKDIEKNSIRQAIRDVFLDDFYKVLLDNERIGPFSVDYYYKSSYGIAYVEQIDSDVVEEKHLELIRQIRDEVRTMKSGTRGVILCFVYDSIPQKVIDQLYEPWLRIVRYKEIPLFLDLNTNKSYFPVQKYDLYKNGFRGDVIKFIEKFPDFFEK